MSIMADSLRVGWIDLVYIKRNILSILVTSLVSPLLYLIAFGYGLGNGMKVDGYDYIAFMIPGVISMTTMTACFNTVASKVMMQRAFYESFDELFLCSIRPAAIIIGKTYAGLVRGLISCTVLYGIGLIITADMHINIQSVILIVFSCLTYSLMGIVAGMFANSFIKLNLFTSLVIVPMTFLSGTLFSLDAMPEMVHICLEILPLTHSTACIRASVLEMKFPFVSLIVMTVFAAVFYCIGRYMLTKGRN